jgi:predicted transcriptional regulator of viral defense system
MSAREAELLTTLAAAGQRVFTVEDARAALADGSDPLPILQRLTIKRWLRRVERGKYKQAVWEAIGDLKSLAWEVRSTVSERRLEKEQLAAIQEAIARAREAIEKNLAG